MEAPESSHPPSSESGKSPRLSRMTLSTLMMPEHANMLGNVHGGVIMKMVDECAALAAMRHAQRPCVTVAIDSMTFRHPVAVGSLVTCTAQVAYAHRSSMEIEVEVIAENPITGSRVHSNSAYLVFVALGPDGRSASVPQLALETEQEKAAFEAGRQRQEARLARRTQDDARPV